MMKNMRKMLLLGVMVLAMGASTVTAFGTTSTTTSGAVSLDALKAQRLELHKEILADRVEAGLITQEQADAIIDQIEENQAICDGTGSYGYGRMMGLGAGRGIGGGYGLGAGCGGGYGMMRGWNQ